MIRPKGGLKSDVLPAQLMSMPSDHAVASVKGRSQFDVCGAATNTAFFAIGISFGANSGYAINPARDLGPRIAHALLPIRGKGESDWAYSWVPVLGPILGAVLAAAVIPLVVAL